MTPSLLCVAAVFVLSAVGCAGEESQEPHARSGALSEAALQSSEVSAGAGVSGSGDGLSFSTQCEGGLTWCGDGCVDLNTDRFNCGVCGGDCNYGGAHTVCEDGYCNYVGVKAEPSSGASGTTALDDTTWQFVTTVYCYQATGHNCYVDPWNPRCPSDPDSKTCWSPGTSCYRVADDYEVEVFECR